MERTQDARLFQARQTVEQRQAEMKNGVLQRMRQSTVGRAHRRSLRLAAGESDSSRPQGCTSPHF